MLLRQGRARSSRPPTTRWASGSTSLDPDGNRFEFFCETVTDDEEGKRVLGHHNAPSEPFVLDPLYT